MMSRITLSLRREAQYGDGVILSQTRPSTNVTYNASVSEFRARIGGRRNVFTLVSESGEVSHVTLPDERSRPRMVGFRHERSDTYESDDSNFHLDTIY